MWVVFQIDREQHKNVITVCDFVIKYIFKAVLVYFVYQNITVTPTQLCKNAKGNNKSKNIIQIG